MLKKFVFMVACGISLFPLAAVPELKTTPSFHQALQNNSLVVVDFFMPHCGPCKLLAPLLDQLISQLPTVKFFKADINSLESLSNHYHIRSVPCLIFFKNGVEIGRHVGCSTSLTATQLHKKISSAFGL